MRIKRNRSRARAGWGLMLIVSALTVVALAASPAAAAGMLDQSYGGMSGSGSIDITPEVGQTFTAGITGALDQVDLGLSLEAPDAFANIELRTTSGGIPTETVLATAAVTAESLPAEPAFVPIPIGPVPVTSGVKYAIVMTGTGFRFHGDIGGSYAGGDAVSRGSDGVWRIQEDTDLAFRTYVTVPPEPCKLLRLPLTPLLPITICI